MCFCVYALCGALCFCLLVAFHSHCRHDGNGDKAAQPGRKENRITDETDQMENRATSRRNLHKRIQNERKEQKWNRANACKWYMYNVQLNNEKWSQRVYNANEYKTKNVNKIERIMLHMQQQYTKKSGNIVARIENMRQETKPNFMK